MKNLFEIVCRSDDATYEKFVSRRLSKATSDRLEELSAYSDRLEKRLAPPAFMIYTYLPALALGLALILSILLAKSGFGTAYKYMGHLLYIGAALFSYGVFCRVFIFIKNRKSRNNPVIDDF